MNAGRRASSREAGFSVLETVTSALLMAVVAAIAMQLWNHSLHLIGSSGRSLTDASLMPLTAALRNDLLVASGIEVPTATWSGRDLVLRTQEGEPIRYQLDAGAVTRTGPGAGSAETCRRFGNRVSRWQWRMTHPGLIEIRVGYQIHEEPGTAARRQGPQQRARTMARTLTLELALRGRDGGMSW